MGTGLDLSPGPLHTPCSPRGIHVPGAAPPYWPPDGWREGFSEAPKPTLHANPEQLQISSNIRNFDHSRAGEEVPSVLPT